MSARYPLYADTAQTTAPPAGPPPAGPPPPSAVTSALPPYAEEPLSRRSVAPWLVAVLALVVLAIAGGGLALVLSSGDGDDADGSDRDGPRDQRSSSAADPADEALLTPADIAVPDTAPASVDEHGNPVSFTAGNMADADPRTSWRMPGDGSGSVVTFTFDETVTVSEVGLVNGYAKTDPPHDWYAGNRRIQRVTWVFDDGTEVTQELDEVRDLQSVTVEGVETTMIELRIVEVTEPGTGADRRDFTAISEVEIAGR